jgi:uncharacterized phiE125 gp8 family phage protein
MSLIEITAPTVEPVSIAEAKEHLRIDHTRDDATIRAMITAARQYGENRTKRAWCTRTLELVLDEFEDVIYLPRPPLQSVTSVKYIDAAGTQQTVDSGDYEVDADHLPPRVFPVYGGAWPATRDEVNAVRIRYDAGYTTSIPQILKSWILSRVGTMYENRESLMVGQQVIEIPRPFVDALLDAFRVIEFK